MTSPAIGLWWGLQYQHEFASTEQTSNPLWNHGWLPPYLQATVAPMDISWQVSGYCRSRGSQLGETAIGFSLSSLQSTFWHCRLASRWETSNPVPAWLHLWAIMASSASVLQASSSGQLRIGAVSCRTGQGEQVSGTLPWQTTQKEIPHVKHWASGGSVISVCRSIHFKLSLTGTQLYCPWLLVCYHCRGK